MLGAVGPILVAESSLHWLPRSGRSVRLSEAMAVRGHDPEQTPGLPRADAALAISTGHIRQETCESLQSCRDEGEGRSCSSVSATPVLCSLTEEVTVNEATLQKLRKIPFCQYFFMRFATFCAALMHFTSSSQD